LVKDEDGKVVVSLYDEAIKDEQDKPRSKEKTKTPEKTTGADETVNST
jgi:hypothetical protein